MRGRWTGLLLAAVIAASTVGAAPSYLDLEPLERRIDTRLRPVSGSRTLAVPTITWGGDAATVHAVESGAFRKAGLDVELFLENDFPKQVEAVLSGKSPFLRGTLGMINSAAEVFRREGIDLVVIYQLTWSTGGDALVVRPGVTKPSQLRGKTIVLQRYGPHMDYLANVLSSAQVPLDSVKLRWLPELTLPSYDTKGRTLDPVSAFVEDSGNDAVMCIIPDALALTSGGEGGTGAAGSVKDARILLSTKTASRIIADVYAVRSDWFEANRGTAEKFVRTLMQGTDEFLALRAEPTAEYRERIAAAAELLLGSPQAGPDVEALLGDCEFVGRGGNVSFFTGAGTTRNLEVLNREIQSGFRQMGLLAKNVPLRAAGFDYASLGVTGTRAESKPRFDAKRTAAKVEQMINVEPEAWAEEGTLFQVEIGFAPNQSVFSAAQYRDDFQKALELAQSYGGALIVIEGHSDPLGILKAKRKGENPAVLRQMEQQAKNLSMSRALAVRESFVGYCRDRDFRIDESQFVPVGLGIATPKFSPPRTADEWAANRRVVFRIKQVEAELSEFSPLE